MIFLKLLMKTPYLIIVLQFTITLLLAIIFWFSINQYAAVSAFLGGLAGIVPNMYFIWKIFGNKLLAAKTIIKNFFIGEFVKLLLGALFLVLLVRFTNLQLLYLIIGYLATFLAVFFLPLITKNL
jgi:ATP synthase protein I